MVNSFLGARSVSVPAGSRIRRDRVHAQIQAAMDPLRARLRCREIRQLARALRTCGVRPLPLVLALGLLDQADAAADEHARVLCDLQRLRDALATHGTWAERALLDDHLRTTGCARADFGALDRLLSRGAAYERIARTLAQKQGIRETALFAVGTLAADARTSRTHLHAPALAIPVRLLGHATDAHAAWQVRVVALEALGRVLSTGAWSLTDSGTGELGALVVKAEEKCWVQVAAARALFMVSAGRAHQHVRERIARPSRAPDDAIVRAGLVALLADPGGDAGSDAVGAHECLTTLALAAYDPAEHVRQAVARACLSGTDRAFDLLLRDLSDPAKERSPRVRGVAIQSMGARARGAAGKAARAASALLLVSRVLAERDPLPRAIACDAACEACVEPGLDPGAARLLCDALHTARHAKDLQGPVLGHVARAAERARAATDPMQALLRRSLENALRHLRERGKTTLTLPLPCTNLELGRALAELAQEDFGLYAHRQGARVHLRRGDRHSRHAWRLWHELRHPLSSKRQGHNHTVGRVVTEPLRAHSGILAEVTRTRVPGERVFVEGEGGWASYLPLVDDLLGTGLIHPVTAELFSEHGVTRIVPPPRLAQRLVARASISAHYGDLDDLRLRSLTAKDPRRRAAYVRAVRRLGFGLLFLPHDGTDEPHHVHDLFAGAAVEVPCAGTNAAAFLGPVLAMVSLFHTDLSSLLFPSAGTRTRELLALTSGIVAFLFGRALWTQACIRAWRRSLPLCIGGWGTRGKSGVERLKAALFHALGYEVLSKTTGCEATVIVGVPGLSLVEVPLYRPYEKATIWEQRDVLRLAGLRKPHVLLWECMALNPRYVELLQRVWMKDDLSTVTNAYPDHEDIQGPTGVDVARVIARFTPHRATLLTAEEQMLPILAESARQAGTRLVTVNAYEPALLPEEIVARFPYQEHRKNIALVLALAQELGIPRDVALVEMADHVVPDIGGLRQYGPITIHDRRLRFANGMSANERASALYNWRRLGFDRHETDVEPGRWIVAFVNNRADRAARSLTFADALVEDLAVHRIVLVGTGTSGLRQTILEAMARRLSRLDPTELPPLLERLKIGVAEAPVALAEIEAWRKGIPGATGTPLGKDRNLCRALEQALCAGSPEEIAEARARIHATGAPELLMRALLSFGMAKKTAEGMCRFATDSWLRRRAGACLRRNPNWAGRARVITDLYLAMLVEPAHPEGNGGDLIDMMACACPPGAYVDVMGLMNIKGPGLAVARHFAQAERTGARLFATGISAQRTGATLDDVTTLRHRHVLLRWASVLMRSLDHVVSVGRRRQADLILSDLAHGRIARESAACELARLQKEQDPDAP